MGERDLGRAGRGAGGGASRPASRSLAVSPGVGKCEECGEGPTLNVRELACD